jgi:hypothetical protein
MGQLNGSRSSRRKQEDERKQRTPDEEWNTNFKYNHKRKYRNKTSDSDSDREGLEEVDRKKYHEHTRKSSFNRNKDDNSRKHEEYSDVDRVTINRDNEKQHDRKGRNSQKWIWDSSRSWIHEAGCDEDRDGDGRRHHSSRRKGSRHQRRDSSNVTDESESDKDRGHEEYSDVDWDTMSRDNEKQHGSKGRNSQKGNSDSRYRIYEAGSDEDRHRKRHHGSQRKGSRHRSRDSSNVADESESDKDGGHEYSDVDWDTMSRDNEKQHDSKGRNSQKWSWGSRYRIHEAEPDEDRHTKRHHSSQRKGLKHQSRDNSKVTDKSESVKDRDHEEYSDVDWDTTSRDNEKQHDSKGKNSHKRNGDSRYQIDEAGSDEDRHRKKHLSSQMKESRHQSGDSCYGIDESDKDRGEMGAQHDYSRKSSRHKRSDLRDYCEEYENENDKVDGGWSQRDSDRRAHHHKKKRLKYQKKLDSTNGELSCKNPSEDRQEQSKGSDKHL